MKLNVDLVVQLLLDPMKGYYSCRSPMVVFMFHKHDKVSWLGYRSTDDSMPRSIGEYGSTRWINTPVIESR
jgi:hypothetical protein